MRRMVRVALACVLVTAAAVVAVARVAHATPPSVVSVGSSGGVVSVTWTLPPSGVAWSVEVASSSQVDDQGYFIADNVVDTAVVDNTATSWTGSVALPAGTYYVHVSGQDTSCTTCPIPEWSPTKSLVIGGGGSSSGTTTATTTVTTTTATKTVTTGGTTTSGTTTSSSSPTTTTSSTPTAPVLPSGPNRAPTLQSFELFRSGGHPTATVRICDDRPGALELYVTALRGHGRKKLVRKVAADAGGCWPYLVAVPAPRGSGRTIVSMRVRDAGKLWSRTLVGRFG